MTNHITATAQRWVFFPQPLDGDPPDISFALWERINVDDRVKIVRAQLVYQKAMLQAQLALLEVIESVANAPLGR